MAWEEKWKRVEVMRRIFMHFILQSINSAPMKTYRWHTHTNTSTPAHTRHYTCSSMHMLETLNKKRCIDDRCIIYFIYSIPFSPFTLDVVVVFNQHSCIAFCYKHKYTSLKRNGTQHFQRTAHTHKRKLNWVPTTVIIFCYICEWAHNLN